MYTDHFELQERPFVNDPAECFFLPNDEVASAVSRIRQALLGRDSVVLITGGPGVGKTAIIEQALSSIHDQAIVAHLDMRHTEADSLYDMLSIALGDNASNGGVENSIQVAQRAIGKQNKKGRRVTVAIDIAKLTADKVKSILRLVHMAGQPGGQLNIILQGPHALHKVLDIPGLIHIRQRVCFRYRARPFVAEETEAYIKHQFEAAGGDVDKILSNGVSSTVNQYVAGVPRLINTMMDAALSEAFVQQMEQITGELIGDLANRLGWKPLGQRPAKPAAPAQNIKAAPQAAPPNAAAAPEQGDSTQNTAGPVLIDRSLLDAPQDPASTMSLLKPATALGDATARLMAASESGPDEKTQAKPEPEPAPEPEADNAALPEMNPQDTSATGMLRLEDLSERFAETVFGQDADAFAAMINQEKKTGSDS